MYKGKVITVHSEQRYAKVSCNEFKYELHCPGYLVKKNKLTQGLLIEFQTEFSDKFRKEQITFVKVKKPLEKLFKLGLNIDKLHFSEYNQFCEMCIAYVSNKNFKENVSTSKLRKIFSEVIKIEQGSENVKIDRLVRLRPKLAYFSGRDSGISEFMEILQEMISQINQPTQVTNFKDFLEAIVCYKKEVGGKK